MKNKKLKILVFFLAIFAFTNSVFAGIKPGYKIRFEEDNNGNKEWIVTSVKDYNGKEFPECNINNPNEPTGIEVDHDYFETIGFAYENVCLKGGWKHAEYCSTSAISENDLEEACENAKRNQGNNEESSGGGGGEGAVIPGDKEHSTPFNPKPGAALNDFKDDKRLAISDYRFENTKNKPSNVTYVIGSDAGRPFVGPSVGSKEWAECLGVFLDYYEKCSATVTIHCHKSDSNNCCREVSPAKPAKNGKPAQEAVIDCTCNDSKNYDVGPTTVTKENFQKDCVPTKEDDFKNYAKNNSGLSCDQGGNIASITVTKASCEKEYYRSKYEAHWFECSEVGPSKVEVYGNHLTVNKQDAYCVTPSAGWNKEYNWDINFDASKCKNSLEMYQKDGSSNYDIDCGYSYIMAEAKRLNEVLGHEEFDYGVISTAMRLFGTGITGNDSSLGEISGKEYLEAGGYYAIYRGWGYGEYVGIPNVRDNINRTDWAELYSYFMPEFHSIYIHSATKAQIYLKKNIRYTDVGNLKDANGNVIIDPYYYLEPIKCESLETTCESKVINLLKNDLSAEDRFNALASQEAKDKLKNEAIQICTNQKNMGVMCGTKDEKGKADYIKAVYLYIRALQGNKIVYESKIENTEVEYKPIEGLTKVIYESNTDNDKGIYPVLRFTIDKKSITEDVEVDCDVNDPETKDKCKAQIFVFDAKGNPITEKDHYDYCKKNYCYVKLEGKMICQNKKTEDKITSIVVTEPNIKTTVIKKIDNGIEGQQILFVYDPTSVISGGFCQEIEAVQEDVSTNCPCEPEEHPNLVIPIGNINNENNCGNEYKPYSEYFAGDPSMSTVINACQDEDKKKYEFTKDLNSNGNNIVYDAELDSRYSFQENSDDFGVCKLYCRDENRFYIADKKDVISGRHLQYDVGQTLIDKKIINETAGKTVDKNNKITKIHNYMPAVVLQLRECTSVIDFNKWKSLYQKASSQKEKDQLIYSIYNCNLYTTDEIREQIRANNIKNIFASRKETPYVENGVTKYKYEYNKDAVESAMIDYEYNRSNKKVNIIKDYGTTKDYLLTQGAEDKIEYSLVDYDDTYKDILGINIKKEQGLVDSNLNKTVYCTGEKCYKLKAKNTNGGYYSYNPYAKEKNDFTTVEDIYNIVNNQKQNIKFHESGKILRYDEWVHLKDHPNSEYESEFTKLGDGNLGPTNQYASFVTVYETGFYNSTPYYSDRYTGLISTDKTNKNVELDRQILPIHLDKETGTYEIKHSFKNVKPSYKRSKYYYEHNYDIFDKIKNKNDKPLNYTCTYNAHNQLIIHPTGDLGFTYRIVDLNDIFESVTDNKRKLPENWNTELGKNSRNQIELSADSILDKSKNKNSYLEYSYTLTPEGINRIKKYNTKAETANGYLNDTLYNCQYDEKEGIFYNCKSSFLDDLNDQNGAYKGLIKVEKGDGVSEFCSSAENENKDYCKYQKKHVILGGND